MLGLRKLKTTSSYRRLSSARLASATPPMLSGCILGIRCDRIGYNSCLILVLITS
jgi:hypothetical protein